ncbi:nuclear transport factor 2 family protein [Roseibium sp.]|uniref:nuclear transport factor 2 family protein n=1 Tax=Roseibium sp. TaxID=1936156 RepID=UPI003BA8B74B
MTIKTSNTGVVRSFVDAFNAADHQTMASCLAVELVAEVTQRDGSTKQVKSRDAYMNLIAQLDIGTVRPTLTITQIADVNKDQVLAMFEVRAVRKGRKLHNFAAYLMTIRGQQINRIWMVEALPEESDTFWSA